MSARYSVTVNGPKGPVTLQNGIVRTRPQHGTAANAAAVPVAATIHPVKPCGCGCGKC